eukprot:GHVU01232329.1.p1 GENE.GHVU01232329.1~~GHVU01232329.1.p1  ORF type:complete len:136 (+),score=16.84 GHVU01232329.1:414-821(+)
MFVRQASLSDVNRPTPRVAGYRVEVWVATSPGTGWYNPRPSRHDAGVAIDGGLESLLRTPVKNATNPTAATHATRELRRGDTLPPPIVVLLLITHHRRGLPVKASGAARLTSRASPPPPPVVAAAAAVPPCAAAP